MTVTVNVEGSGEGCARLRGFESVAVLNRPAAQVGVGFPSPDQRQRDEVKSHRDGAKDPVPSVPRDATHSLHTKANVANRQFLADLLPNLVQQKFGMVGRFDDPQDILPYVGISQQHRKEERKSRKKAIWRREEKGEKRKIG